ncbi:MAG: hypothetical protein WA395_01235 [Nitrososphaeraceae archaeon]|jgi:hypothetical protein
MNSYLNLKQTNKQDSDLIHIGRHYDKYTGDWVAEVTKDNTSVSINNLNKNGNVNDKIIVTATVIRLEKFNSTAEFERMHFF